MQTSGGAARGGAKKMTVSFSGAAKANRLNHAKQVCASVVTVIIAMIVIMIMITVV